MLSPYTVLDLTDDRGEFTSMALGDMGADVIKVKPPQGSTSRGMGPYMDGAPESERSLHYFAFNRSKRGVTLDLTSEDGRSALMSLAEKADFVIESAAPGEMDRLGVDFDAMKRANPKIVYVAITPYGQDGPNAHLAASDLTLAAMGGQMGVQGDPNRAPVRITVPQVWFHTAAEAMVGALTAHARMLVTGEAQFVDVSAQASMVWAMLHARVAHAVQGADLNRSGSVLQLGTLTMPLVHECADGFIVVAPFGATLTKLVPLMVADGTVPEEWIESEDWPIYELNLLQQNPVRYQMDEVLGAMGSFLRGRTKSELLDLGLRNSVTIAPVSTTEDLARFRQLEERGYWLTAPLPNWSETKVPGVLGRPAETPMSVSQWAPTLGQHNSDILGGELGLSDDETAAASGRGA